MTTNTYGIAGQVAPVAVTETTLYECVSAEGFIASTLVVCNRDTTGAVAEYSIAVVKSGDTLNTASWLRYKQLLKSRGSVELTLGISLANGDKVIVESSTADTSYTLFGVKRT